MYILQLPQYRSVEIVKCQSPLSEQEFTRRYITNRLNEDVDNKPWVFSNLEDFLTNLSNLKEPFGFQVHNSCIDHTTICVHFTLPIPDDDLGNHCSVAIYGWGIPRKNK